MIKLKYGLTPSPDAIAAWGARAIYKRNPKAYELNRTKTGAMRKRGLVPYFDLTLLHDRQDIAFDGTAEIGTLKLLTRWVDQIGVPWLRKACNDYKLENDSEAVLTFTDGQFALRASPNKSHGYLYIVVSVAP